MISIYRKIDSECRIFKEQWTYDYFFMQYKERAVCLVYQNIVSVFKEYNLCQHYQTQNTDKYDCLVGDVRKDKILKLKNTLTTQQNTFVKYKQLNISSLRASFQVAKLIVCTGRPFMEGEFVKECLLSVAKEMCPEKADLFSTLSLSGTTITRRIEEMGDNLHQHLQNSARKLSYFSLALNESNDVHDSAQLLIFIHELNDNCEVTEELDALQSIKGTTTEEDNYEKFSQSGKDLELDWAKLASVTTDGVPSMVGSKKGVIAHINQEMDKHNHSHPKAIHCLIHQQALLCSKSLKWDSVMKIVVSCVNFIRANALNHRQFQLFLSELNVAYEDVLYHTEVLWLSQGRVLRHFYDLLPQITAFMFSKNKEVPELNDAEWKWYLAFLIDVTELLNSFNVQLQGKRKLICDIQPHVKAFEVKLGLLIKQVEENFCHLLLTQNLLAEKPLIAFPKETCVDSLEKLQKEFQFRFKELHLHEQDIQLFRNSFSIDIENVYTIYQMELAKLQNCDSPKDAFKSSSLLNFYASLPPRHPNLRNHALKMATIFGSTYVCEQTFSRMKLSEISNQI
uniref:HAT C-terminal dimerisation domain-containing protein n=1 Tax=Monodelphis domestica TaxID=13616 RepID=A0A5F8GNQ2_MONDO